MTARDKAVFIADHVNFQGYMRQDVIDSMAAALVVLDDKCCKAAVEEYKASLVNERDFYGAQIQQLEAENAKLREANANLNAALFKHGKNLHRN